MEPSTPSSVTPTLFLRLCDRAAGDDPFDDRMPFGLLTSRRGPPAFTCDDEPLEFSRRAQTLSRASAEVASRAPVAAARAFPADFRGREAEWRPLREPPAAAEAGACDAREQSDDEEPLVVGPPQGDDAADGLQHEPELVLPARLSAFDEEEDEEEDVAD
jgi:hypothetical protein